jgi:YfiH family protein
MIRWEQAGYLVAFTTRAGGVSSGVYESLNLTTGTGDEAGLVEENRRIACRALGLDATRLAFNRQVHSPTVHRAHAGKRGREGDGLWSDEPLVPLLAMSADCLPIAIARLDEPRALAVLHAGWRGLSEGVIAAGVAALGAGPKAAMVGPAIGPCCYEVGDEVATPFREAFGEDVVRDGKLDLWTSAERALRAAGVEHVERFDLCTACSAERFFSHRRDHGKTGRQGVIAYVA